MKITNEHIWLLLYNALQNGKWHEAKDLYESSISYISKDNLRSEIMDFGIIATLLDETSIFKSSKSLAAQNIMNTQILFRQKLYEERNEENKNIVGSKLIDLSLQYFQDFHASAAPMQHAAIIIAFEA